MPEERGSDELKSTSSFFEKITGRTAQLTGFLVAIAALLAAIPPITEGIRAAYCSISSCTAVPTKLEKDTESQVIPRIKSIEQAALSKGLPQPEFNKQTIPNEQQLSSVNPTNLPKNDMNNPPTNKPSIYGAGCSNTNFFMKRPEGWDWANEFKAASNVRVFSLITKTKTPPFSLYLAIAPKGKLSLPIKVEKSFSSWISSQWPDGTIADCNKQAGYYGNRIDLILDSDLPPGDYDLFSHFDDEKTVTIKSIKVR